MRNGYRVKTGLAAALVAVGVLGALPGAWANNLRVTNTTVVVVGAPPYDTTIVQFDIAWDNSWRHAFNHDAAWVFFKFKIEGDSAEGWSHATLASTNLAGYSAGVGTSVELIVPADRKGLFVRRAAGSAAAGPVAVTNVRALVNLADSGISASQKVRMQTLAIEMVYVAEGPFWAGDDTSGQSQFTLTQIVTNDPTVTGGRPTGYTPTTNAWPNGFNAFYCMKYEITQGQYADFLNTLTVNQASARYYISTTYRYTISGSYTSYIATRRDRACNYLSWADGAAYADWAALRPMTELEFEKACRGPRASVASEYAWGTATIMPNAPQLSGTENGTETVTNSTALGGCYYGNTTIVGGDGGGGPLRAGIFATNGAGRVSAGASYWGIMELSGNVWERPVTMGNATGQAFSGLHGDGVLTDPGIANVTNWPPSSGASEATGAGFRGGDWSRESSCARVSDRTHAALVNAGRIHYTFLFGSRGVRSAPSGVGP